MPRDIDRNNREKTPKRSSKGKKGKNKIKARAVNDGKSRYFLTDLCKIKKKYRQQKHKSILLDRLQEFSVYASFKNVLECLREKSHRNRSDRHR